VNFVKLGASSVFFGVASLTFVLTTFNSEPIRIYFSTEIKERREGSIVEEKDFGK
jgi:hypothetical protein